MNNDWLLLRAGQTFGPYPAQHVQQMAAAGQLLATDLLSQGTLGNWAPPHHVLAFLAANRAMPPLATPLVADVVAESSDEIRPSAARRQANAAQRTVWGRFKTPILIAGAATVVLIVVIVVVSALGTPSARRAAMAQHIDKPATAKSKTPLKAPAQPGVPSGTPLAKSPAKLPGIAPSTAKSHLTALKAREVWIAAKGEPLETHTFVKTPQVEVLIWRTGNDQHDLATLNYAMGTAAMNNNLTRLDVEAIIDSYFRR